jgi:putative ABC transport system permease protein
LACVDEEVKRIGSSPLFNTVSMNPIRYLLASGAALVRDLQFAARQLWRSRGFATIALLMLALPIGVNIAVFTVANTALFKGFPLVQQNDRILYLTTTKSAVSYPDYQDWQSRAESFERIAMSRGVFTTLSTGGAAPTTQFTTQVTANAFALLGVRPILGRDFLPSDQERSAAPVVILRNDLWKSRFAGRQDIIGSTILLNGVPTVVIGVMPENFSFPEDQMLWTPLVPTDEALDRRNFFARYAFGRLAPGATRESAAAEMATIGHQLANAYPDSNSNRLPVVSDFREFFVGDTGSKTYQALWWSVGLVLLIASANVANLLLNRSMRRSRDVAVRLALGAGRGAVVRTIVVESLLLSVLAGVIGCWIAELCVRAYVSAQAGALTAGWSYTADAQLLAYAVGLSIGAACLVSVPAALWITRSNINSTLKHDDRGVVGGGGARRFAALLIAAEIALALIVLTGAGLMARSVVNVYTARIGVNAANVLTMSMYVPGESYPDGAAQMAFYQRLADQLKGVPGVESVAIASVAPTDRAAHVPYAMGTAVPVDEATQSTVGRMTVGAGYFQTMQASVLSGRDFNDFDGSTGEAVAIVNQAFARRHATASPLIGKRLQLFQDGAAQSLTIVGVASDIVQSDRTRQDVEPLVYVPYLQRPQPNMFVFARTRVEPASLATAFSAAVYAMDPSLPVPGLMPLRERFARAYRFESTTTTILASFAALALVLAVIGLYAIVAHSVRARSREIGIRRALGATTAQIRRLVLREAIGPLIVGVTIGVAASVTLAPVLQPILVKVSGTDPGILAAASLTLAVAALAGCLLPARSALSIDPAIILRHD